MLCELGSDTYNSDMLTSEAQARLAVVLVGVRNPQNIGAVARAMRDLGFTDLRVVNEYTPPLEAAQLEASSAVAAGEILRAAQRFDRLEDAIADCTIVAGTTAIGGRGLSQPVLKLQEAAPLLQSALVAESPAKDSPSLASEDVADSLLTTYEPTQAAGSRVALLFGSEKTGLTNEQLSHCSLLLTIPMFAPVGRHLSMNLGQAVAVCLYELTRDGFAGERTLPHLSQAAANSADRERLHGLLSELMQCSGYAHRFPANARSVVVRRLVQTLGEGKEQAATWMGLLKMVLSQLHTDGLSRAASGVPSTDGMQSDT